MRPHQHFVEALEAAIDAESDSDSDDEHPGQPVGCEAEVAGSKRFTDNIVNSRRRDVCRPLTPVPEAISVF